MGLNNSTEQTMHTFPTELQLIDYSCGFRRVGRIYVTFKASRRLKFNNLCQFKFLSFLC